MEVYQSVKKFDEVALILSKQKKTQELLELMWQMGKDFVGVRTIEICLGYFLENQKPIYAKECFVKLNKERDLLDYYVKEEKF